MSFESKSSSLHLETAKEAEERIEGITPPASPVEEATPSTEGVGNAQVIETQRVAEQSEAEELLKRMHENADIKQEAAAVTPRVEKKQEKPVTKEMISSSEQVQQQEMEKLYGSLDLPRREGEGVLYSRESLDEEGTGIRGKIKTGLAGEVYNDGKRREKFFKGALLTAGAGTAVGIGGMTFLGVGTAALGFGTGGLALGVGALGWAGMKAFHAWKERKHEKAFDAVKYGY